MEKMKRFGYKEVIAENKFYNEEIEDEILLIQYDLINSRYNVISLNLTTNNIIKLGYMDYRTNYKLNKLKLHSKTAKFLGLDTYLKQYEVIIK